MMNKEGHIGVVKRTENPIEKVKPGTTGSNVSPISVNQSVNNRLTNIL